MEYLVYQEEECPETKKRHIQGFVQVKKQMRYGGLKDLLGDQSVHIEPMRGTPKEASEYCKKEESRVKGGIAFEGGQLRLQGQRTDLAITAEKIHKGAQVVDLIHDEDTVETVAKYPRFVETCIQEKKKEDGLEQLRKEMSEVTLRPWQQDVVSALTDNEPDKRSVVWIYDSVGNVGKSFIADYFIVKYKAVKYEPGRFLDLAYAFSKEPTTPKAVFIDCPRSTEKKDQAYDPLSGSLRFAEKLKDGIMTSTKYDSRTIYFRRPHVVFLANFLPDTSLLSKDRWVICEIASAYGNMKMITAGDGEKKVKAGDKYNPIPI